MNQPNERMDGPVAVTDNRTSDNQVLHTYGHPPMHGQQRRNPKDPSIGDTRMMKYCN